jgi:hypothetical membrane protein
MKYSSQRIAGAVLLFGLAQFVLFLQIAQDLYPNYSTSYISDLGATCRFPAVPCTIVQPSSFIFNTSIFILGVLVVISAYYIHKAYRMKGFSLFLLLGGLGAMGVGLFPETTGTLHIVVSFITFVFIGLAAVVSYRIEHPPLSYVSVILGLMTLVDMVLLITGNYLGIGIGGMERMILYPILVWGVALAGYLINAPLKPLTSLSGD